MDDPRLEFDCGRCRYVSLEYCCSAKRRFRQNKRRTFIYALIDPRDGSVFYIGRTYNPAQRFQMYDYYTRRPDQARGSAFAISHRFQEILAGDLLPIMRLLRSTPAEHGEVRERQEITRHLKLNPALLNRALTAFRSSK